MTKDSTPDAPRYCVRFTGITSYKCYVRAADTEEAIRLAKRQWFYGTTRRFIAFAAETDAWDAELE